MDNRIERISGNNYYEYEKIKNLKVPDTEEKFSLDYKNEPFSARAKEKEEKEEEEKDPAQAALQNGVRLELSNNGRTAGAGKTAKTAPQAATDAGNAATLSGQVSSFVESIRNFITSTITAVKDFFDKIWNEPTESVNEISSNPPEPADMTSFADPVSTADVTPEIYATPQEAALAMQRNETLLDREIRPYLKSGDLDQVISLLTDNGRKTAARNSTLLTYYDKNGRMVEPNASDRERILHGDRNTRKL
ncbi:MAG: hypothetical protein NC434_06500 [Ruminococcus sp.]|nr:hypothetical protein [Ruminococcus sp.]